MHLLRRSDRASMSPFCECICRVVVILYPPQSPDCILVLPSCPCIYPAALPVHLPQAPARASTPPSVRVYLRLNLYANLTRTLCLTNIASLLPRRSDRASASPSYKSICPWSCICPAALIAYLRSRRDRVPAKLSAAYLCRLDTLPACLCRLLAIFTALWCPPTRPADPVPTFNPP